MQPVEWHMKKVEVPEDKENGILVRSLLTYKLLNRDKNIQSNGFDYIQF